MAAIFGLIAAAGIALGALSVIVYTLRYGISPMPTSPRVRRVLLGLLPEDPGGPVAELGAGWGTLAFPLARRWPDRPGDGVRGLAGALAVHALPAGHPAPPQPQDRPPGLFRRGLSGTPPWWSVISIPAP